MWTFYSLFQLVEQLFSVFQYIQCNILFIFWSEEKRFFKVDSKLSVLLKNTALNATPEVVFFLSVCGSIAASACLLRLSCWHSAPVWTDFFVNSPNTFIYFFLCLQKNKTPSCLFSEYHCLFAYKKWKWDPITSVHSRRKMSNVSWWSWSCPPVIGFPRMY